MCVYLMYVLLKFNCEKMQENAQVKLLETMNVSQNIVLEN